MAKLVYMTFSNNTERFIKKLDYDGEIMKLDKKNPKIENNEKYILILPSYEDEIMYSHVIEFLDTGNNADNCVGIVGTGNMAFDAYGLYGVTAKRMGKRYGIEVMRIFELTGGVRDVKFIEEELDKIE